MHRWGMVIDLKKCLGCQTCVLACKLNYGLGPDIARCKVVEHETGDYPDVQRVFMSLRCMQCAEPECLKVCPSGATRKRSDGIVEVDGEECIGCRYCSLACPYQARTFLATDKRYFPDENAWEMKRYTEHTIGTVEKCDFCKGRIDEGLEQGLMPGQDPDASPMCVIACIGKALHFGDLNDADSEVSRLIREKHGYVLKGEVGTQPSIYFLPKRR